MSLLSRDVLFRYVGEGLPIYGPLCFYCNEHKQREGGRMRGPFSNLFSCRDCEEKRRRQAEARKK